MMAPTPGNDRNDLLQQLRDLESALLTAEIEQLMAGQPEDKRRDFVRLRQQVAILKGRLENAQLASIAAKLDELAPELKAGIEQMKAALKAVDNAIAILNTASTVLGLVARIVPIV
jgi:hypothetical protein